jgi:queuine tRNA-ribosyltransferase
MMFDIKSTDENSKARSGIMKIKNRTFDTPGFLPVATKADVKLVSPDELLKIGAQGVISNAFLLSLRPGVDVIESAGGLGKFMKWPGLIFTDSGGFQILNPEFLIKVEDNCVVFRSPFDGKRLEFSPKLCAEIQMRIGSDIALTLDDCPSWGTDYEKVMKSTARTMIWAEQFKAAHDDDLQRVFGIVQGGTFEDLRRKCTEAMVNLDFDGYAIGGLCIGEPKDVMHRVISQSTPLMPEEKPRYLMGVGSPEDMLEAISHGVDIFDSVFPTRNARHNTVYTRSGKINIGKEKFKSEQGPVDDGCECYTCKKFTLAYVNHLLREHEYLGMRLATIHNLHFLVNLMREAREAIGEGRFLEFKKEFITGYCSDRNSK